MGRFRKTFQASALGRVSQHSEQKAYLSIGGLLQKKNKQGGLGNAFVNSTVVSRFFLKILGNSKVIASVLP